MTAIQDPRQRTVDAVFRALERQATDWRRPHLGASQIGKECDRELWYGFRWVQAPEFPGRILALFDRGTREEAIQFQRLRSAGVQVWTVDPATGNQWHVELAPHIGGSMDGVALGLLEAPTTPHVIDVKTASLKQFDKLLKSSVREWKPEYFTQPQLYMHDRRYDLDRAALWVVCKDDDRIYLERFPYDPEFATRQLNRAVRVVHDPSPPIRISEDPSWFKCKFCSFHATCQGGHVEKLERNCRTCVSSTPKQDGTWYCDHHEKTLDVAEQKRGCDQHVMHFDLAPRTWEPVDSSGRSVTYEDSQGKTHKDEGGTWTRSSV